jgi:pimeloyl-ACP methyl ester carboxylesterase
MPFKSIRSVDIHYQIIGEDGPWVALITGGRRPHGELISLARKIAAAGYRVLLHDRRNTGASGLKFDTDNVEEATWADDLDALLSELGARPAFIGGSSSGARTAIMFALRHPSSVRALLLMRVTGGAFAAGRLPENYYGQYIRAAEAGGMAAVCETERFSTLIQTDPANRAKIMAMDPQVFVDTHKRWLELFKAGAHLPVMGVTPEELASIKVPVIVIPGNDKTHASASGIAAHKMIAGSELHQLPIEDQDVDLITFDQWAPYEEEIAQVLTDFMRRHRAG